MRDGTTPSDDNRCGGRATIYYDGACPLCSREIAFYRKRSDARKTAFHDVSADPVRDPAPDLKREDALKRFHVRRPDGSLVSGGRAFAVVWQSTPGFRLLGRLVECRPIGWLADRTYDAFLTVRPRLQRLFRSTG